MPNIAGTGVPTAVTSTCPRCHALRTFVSTGPDLLFYTCGGCEWPFTFGAGSGGLATNGATTTASTALSFASGGTQFALIGSVLYISDAGNSEIVVVNGVASATTVPVADFDFSHGSGKTVTLAVATASLPNQDKVPPAGGWGF